MKKFVLHSMFVLGLAVPVWADSSTTSGEPSTQDSTATQPLSEASDSDQAGTIEELSNRLAALVEPMEQKLDDCDGEVAQAKLALKELETKIADTRLVVSKTHRELLVLKEAFGTKGCQIDIGGRRFRRELVGQVLETRIASYQQDSVALKELQVQLVDQKLRVQEAIAKQQRWKRKEEELLAKVALIEQTHESLSTDEPSEISPEQLKEVAEFETEVENMLKVPATPENDESPVNAGGKDTLIATDDQPSAAATQQEPSKPSAAPASNKSTKVKVDMEVAVTPQVEVDAEIDLNTASQTLNDVDTILGDKR